MTVIRWGAGRLTSLSRVRRRRHGDEKRFGRRSGSRDRQPDRDTEEDLGCPDLEGIGDRVAHPSNHAGRGGVVDVGAHDHERAMPDPAETVAGAQCVARPRGYLAEELLARRIAELVVDFVEPVYANADRGRHSAGRCVRQEVVDESDRGETVGEPGRRVEVHVQGETRFEQLSGGDVDVDQHDARAVVNGSGRRVQQEPTILARRRARILELERATLALEDAAQPRRHRAGRLHSGSVGTIADFEVIHAGTGRARNRFVQRSEQPPGLVRIDDRAGGVEHRRLRTKTLERIGAAQHRLRDCHLVEHRSRPCPGVSMDALPQSIDR